MLSRDLEPKRQHMLCKAVVGTLPDYLIIMSRVTYM